jgi:uncharacterized protein (TIGR03067 family)
MPKAAGGEAGANAASPNSPEVEKELNLLQGVWGQVETEVEGKRTQEDPTKITRTFKGDEMTDEYKESHRSYSGKIKIDPTRNPKTLDCYLSGTPHATKYVYELDGDTLRFGATMGVNDYAKEITGKGKGNVMVVYKRQK